MAEYLAPDAAEGPTFLWRKYWLPLVGFGLGLVAPVTEVKWGVGGYLSAIPSALGLLQVVGLQPKERSVSRAVATILVASMTFLLGWGVGLFVTYRPIVLEFDDRVRLVPYDRRDELNWNVHLSGIAGCDEINVDVWGSRRYEIGDNTPGWDVVGWRGTLNDLNPVAWTEASWTVFGQAETDEGVATRRRAQGVICIDGTPHPWGNDNVPDGTSRTTVWAPVGDRWAVTKLPGGEYFAHAMLSFPGKADLVQVWSAGDRQQLVCRSLPFVASVDEVLKTNRLKPVVTLESGEVYLDAARYWNEIVLLTGRRSEDGDSIEYWDLQATIIDSQCRSQARYTLTDARGLMVRSGNHPAVLLGPERTVALAAHGSMIVHLFREGAFQGSTEIDVGFDPSASGIYGFAPGTVPSEYFIMGWAFGAADGKPDLNTENFIRSASWHREDRLCLEWPRVCFL